MIGDLAAVAALFGGLFMFGLICAIYVRLGQANEIQRRISEQLVTIGEILLSRAPKS